VIGTAHGFLFMVYLVTALDLGVRRRWPLLRLGLVMIAGTIPFASFVASTSSPVRSAAGQPEASADADREAPPPNAVTRSERARATRERIVPTGQPHTSAASA